MSQLRQLKGLTWDHPRGYGPLDSAHWQRFGLEIIWNRQPLSGFESRSIEDIASEYDLLVLDHPSMGEVAATGALRPFNEMFDSRTLDCWHDAAIGNTFASYTVCENQWAVPIDAASQVFVSNRKTLPPSDHPKTWNDVMNLADRLPYALSVSGPHAYCTFFSIAVSLYQQVHGMPYDRNFFDGILNHRLGQDALVLLKELFKKSDTRFKNHNPIEILHEIRSGTAISFCPLVFAYVDYDRNQMPTLLAFGEAPSPSPDDKPTSIMGGAGLAISRHTELSDELNSGGFHTL